MEQEELTKVIFFTGYNYYLRYCNIIRKIEDFKRNTERFQKVINEKYKPLIFQGGEIFREGKKILNIKKIKTELKSQPSRGYSYKKNFTSIPYTEEGKYYLTVEIISETTQYCADLASIIIGLKDFKTKKSTFSQIEDAKIKVWYQDQKQPSLEDFVEIFNLAPLNELSPEERFNIGLKYDQLLWNINIIGDFYWYNYDYLYTPHRHGMKGSFCKDSEGRIYCRTLTKDKRYNFLYLSDDKISRCQKIAEIIYSVFHDHLSLILLSKGIAPFINHLRFKVSKAPKLPDKSFNPELIRKEFVDLKNNNIHYFTIKDFASIHKFAKIPENNLEFRYIKMKKGSSFFNIDGSSHYLDSFFSFSKKLRLNEFIIICNCPLAYFIELAFINIISNHIFKLTIEQIKESLYHYLAVEKNINYLLKDPSQIMRRTHQMKAITDETINDFIVLIGLYYNKGILDKLTFSNEELDFFIYFYERKIMRLFNTKFYMKKLYSDIIIQILIQLLIMAFFKNDNPINKYAKGLELEDFQNFLEKSSDFITKSVKNKLELEFLLEFMDLLYNTTNKIERAN